MCDVRKLCEAARDNTRTQSHISPRMTHPISHCVLMESRGVLHRNSTQKYTHSEHSFFLFGFLRLCAAAAATKLYRIQWRSGAQNSNFNENHISRMEFHYFISLFPSISNLFILCLMLLALAGWLAGWLAC